MIRIYVFIFNFLMKLRFKHVTDVLHYVLYYYTKQSIVKESMICVIMINYSIVWYCKYIVRYLLIDSNASFFCLLD